MAGALPLVGPAAGDGIGAIGAISSLGSSARPGSGGDVGGKQELAPAGSGVLALRRVTALLSRARRADAQGEYQQAKELYSEVLKVQKAVSRQALGSIGKSLRDVAAGVEARLQSLRQEMHDGEAGACSSSSRVPTAGNAPSSRGSTGISRGAGCGFVDEFPLPPSRNGRDAGMLSSRKGQDKEHLKIVLQAGAVMQWDTSALGDCPVSARTSDGYMRPTTRDGGIRPCTQEGGRRPGTRENSTAEHWWPQPVSAVHGRPSTRDGRDVRTPQTTDLRLQQNPIVEQRGPGRPGTRELNLTGVRPSTSEQARLQQMIDGGSGGGFNHHASASRGQQSLRGGDGLSKRSNLSDRRCQEASIKQVTGRRKRPPNSQALTGSMDSTMASLFAPEGSPSPPPTGRGSPEAHQQRRHINPVQEHFQLLE